MIRVLLADDQSLVTGALAALLNLEDDIEVVAQVARGDLVLSEVRNCQIDVCLLDIEMPGMNGIEVVAQLRDEAPTVKSLIVTTFGRPGYMRRALEAGASGFVVKDTPAEELAQAVRRVAAGERVVDPQMAVASLTAGQNPLTDREMDVLRVALEGGSIDTIAHQVCLSPGTVRNYMSSAIMKTGTTTRMEAALAAQRNGWL